MKTACLNWQIDCTPYSLDPGQRLAIGLGGKSAQPRRRPYTEGKIMRFIVTASWPVGSGIAAAEAGILTENVQAILDDIKPEACCFTAGNG